MAVVCPLCGAENRDKARFCLGCAASLEPVDGATPVSGRRSSRSSGRRRSSRRARGGWPLTLKASLGLVVFALVAVVVGWWVVVSPADRSAPANPITLLPAPPATPPETLQVLPATPVTNGTEAPTAVSAAERLRATVDDLERQDRIHSIELEQERARIAREVQRSHEAKRRSGAPGLPRPVGAEPDAPETTPPTNPTSPSAPSASAAPSPPPPASSVEPARNVDQICAGSGNFLARDFCRIRECGKPSFASDPVCVRFRQMEDARREQSN